MVEIEPSLGNEEILDVKFHGLYGRLLLAGLKPENTMEFINPDQNLSVDPTTVSISAELDHIPALRILTTDERVSAWRGMDFQESMGRWKTQLVGSVNSATEEKHLDAIYVITGKAAADFKDEDAQRIYDDLCRGKSDATGLVNTIIGKLKKDDKVDTQRLKILIPHIERFTAQLFGKESAKAVIKMVELKAEITNNPSIITQKLFSDDKRLNAENLTQDEKEMLILLRDGLNERSKPRSDQTPKVNDDDNASIPVEESVVKNPEGLPTQTEVIAKTTSPDLSQPEETSEPDMLEFVPAKGQEFNLENGKILKVLEVIEGTQGTFVKVIKPNGSKVTWPLEGFNRFINSSPSGSVTTEEPAFEVATQSEASQSVKPTETKIEEIKTPVISEDQLNKDNLEAEFEPTVNQTFVLENGDQVKIIEILKRTDEKTDYTVRRAHGTDIRMEKDALVEYLNKAGLKPQIPINIPTSVETPRAENYTPLVIGDQIRYEGERFSVEDLFIDTGIDMVRIKTENDEHRNIYRSDLERDLANPKWKIINRDVSSATKQSMAVESELQRSELQPAPIEVT